MSDDITKVERESYIARLESEQAIERAKNANMQVGLEALASKVNDVCDALQAALDEDRADAGDLERMPVEGRA